MAKGDIAKSTIIKKLSNFFGTNCCGVDKNKIYIMEQDGANGKIQLCLSLTAPKIPIQAPPAQESGDFDWSADTLANSASTEPAPIVHVEISQDEQDNIKKMMERLGL